MSGWIRAYKVTFDDDHVMIEQAYELMEAAIQAATRRYGINREINDVDVANITMVEAHQNKSIDLISVNEMIGDILKSADKENVTGKWKKKNKR